MQGRSPAECESRLADLPTRQSEEFRNILSSCTAGAFTDYGVDDAHVQWVVERLGRERSIDKRYNDPEALRDWFRVRVFEAEVVCLPVESIDALLAARKAMRSLRSRIDKCVRIIAAMEGRGRRKAQSALDKLKVALEKAEIRARAELSRSKKMSSEESVREAKFSDGEPKLGTPCNAGTPSSKRTASEAKRKRDLAQQNAQASFMMRFVRGKTVGCSPFKYDGDQSDSRDNKVNNGVDEELTASHEVDRPREGCYAATIAEDRDVMSVSWWLRSCMSAIPPEDLDKAWSVGENDCCNLKTLDANHLKAHLRECSLRRKVALRQVSSILRKYRKGRKDHAADRNPFLVLKRSDCRATCGGNTVKLLQFDENHRPAYYGTWFRRSATATGRRPFGKDSSLDYDYDSEEDWDEEEDGENLSDPEADDERAAEDAELRKLYGSDESDDEDFEETGDEDDEGNDLDGDGSENEIVNNGIDGGGGDELPSNSQESCVDIIGVKKAIDFGGEYSEESNTVNPETGKGGSSNAHMSGTVTENDGSVAAVRNCIQDMKRGKGSIGTKRSEKRRKLRTVQSVIIEGPCLRMDQTANCSSLDQYPVTMLSDSNAIEMFNPFVMDTCSMAGEHPRGRSPGLKSSRAAMDQLARRELALAVEKGSKHSHSRDKIVSEFCLAREAQGQHIPSKNEIVRTINEMATFGKREGDTKACWYLNSPVVLKPVLEKEEEVAIASDWRKNFFVVWSGPTWVSIHVPK